MTWFRAALAAGVLLAAGAARGEVLKVGPEEALKAPSDAARVARDGDVVLIAPGEYYDCAIWRQNGLTIAGPEDAAAPAVLTDVTCQGKAIFVIAGQGVTVRHLTFARARVWDGNGAGIRAEGRDLTVAHSRFVDNQAAILSAAQPDGTIAVLDSSFERNGARLGEGCVATLEIGALRQLRIERGTFGPVRSCDMVRARGVQRTDVQESRFEDGPGAAARHMVAQEGGGLMVRASRFVRGPQAEAAAVLLRDLSGAGPGVQVRESVLENASGRRLALLHNLSPGRAVLAGNRVGPGDVELDESGYWTAKARGIARGAIDALRGAAGAARRAVRSMLPF